MPSIRLSVPTCLLIYPKAHKKMYSSSLLLLLLLLLFLLLLLLFSLTTTAETLALPIGVGEPALSAEGLAVAAAAGCQIRCNVTSTCCDAYPFLRAGCCPPELPVCYYDWKGFAGCVKNPGIEDRSTGAVLEGVDGNVNDGVDGNEEDDDGVGNELGFDYGDNEEGLVPGGEDEGAGRRRRYTGVTT